MNYNGPISRSGNLVDPSTYTEGKLPNPISFIHCNTSGTYRLWNHQIYQDPYLYKGLQYIFPEVTRITDTSNAVLAAGLLTVSL